MKTNHRILDILIVNKQPVFMVESERRSFIAPVNGTVDEKREVIEDPSFYLDRTVTLEYESLDENGLPASPTTSFPEFE